MRPGVTTLPRRRETGRDGDLRRGAHPLDFAVSNQHHAVADGRSGHRVNRFALHGDLGCGGQGETERERS